MNLIPSVSILPWVKRVIWWVLSPKGGLIILLVVLFVAFVAAMISQAAEGVIGQLLGLSGTEGIKNQILTFLGLSMGGILLALQAVIANRRAEAMENAANAQAKANENTEKGQRQERLKNAIEHLGDTSDSVRLGGAYELFHLAQDTEELRQTVLDILCAHIRGTTSGSEYREMYKSKPSEEIQSLLNLLFVQKHEVFKGLRIDLRGGWLNGVKLDKARLEKVVLTGAHLQKAQLSEACLQAVDFDVAQLQEADFGKAQLQGSSFFKAQLQKANLRMAQLQGANLGEACLREAELSSAQLLGANLDSARLQMAVLTNTQLQGADLESAQLQCAVLMGAQLQGATICNAEFHEVVLLGARLQGIAIQSDSSSSFETRIRKRIGEESDLSGIIFAGGLTEDYTDSFVKGLPDDHAEILRLALTRHVGKQRSHELPEDSGAVIGSYTREEAEQWIAEYKEAMSGVPEERDS